MNGSNIIDLLTISHFDKDHISGLDYLFSQYRVKTILLPFVDLPHRIFLAFYHQVNIRSEFDDMPIDLESIEIESLNFSAIKTQRE